MQLNTNTIFGSLAKRNLKIKSHSKQTKSAIQNFIVQLDDFDEKTERKARKAMIKYSCLSTTIAAYAIVFLWSR